MTERNVRIKLTSFIVESKQVLKNDSQATHNNKWFSLDINNNNDSAKNLILI